MNLEALLSEHRKSILNRWIELILESYPADSHHFFKGERDPFANPVGQTILREAGNLFDRLLDGADAAALASPLNEIVKIRSVQDFTPSDAVAFVFMLKRAMHDCLGDTLEKAAAGPSLRAFEMKIDSMALQAFDLYMDTKVRMFEIRSNEINRMAYKLMERAGKIHGKQSQEEDSS